MKNIQGQNRHQATLFPITLDQAISADNQARTIDVFVESLELEEYGFRATFEENGRPAYHPTVLLKLYIYGYLNRIRSSRGLEKECGRNIELMWLMNMLAPDHNTISNFRRDNGPAIKKVFRATVGIAKYFNLIGGELLAGDSTKLRAQNSKKNNFNQKKIDRHLQYIEEKLREYNQVLAESDGDGDTKKAIKDEITKHQTRKAKYKEIESSLQESKEAQISTSDPESRQMITRNNITEVAYNVQTTVDSKHNIPIDYKVTNHNDSKAMGNMLQRAKSILGTNSFIALYDKGYHTGTEFAIAERLGIKVMVAVPATPSTSQAPDAGYNSDKFKYDPTNNTFTCPQGQVLTTNGTWHNSESGSRFQQFKTSACRTCTVRAKCTISTKNGKILQRREHAQLIENNRVRIESDKTTYKKRQAIVEHPYGTIKRQWGYSYVMTKQYMQRASADVGFIMVAYNLMRIINIVGAERLKSYLRSQKTALVALFVKIWHKISNFKGSYFSNYQIERKNKRCPTVLKMPQQFSNGSLAA
jgi:transposase